MCALNYEPLVLRVVLVRCCGSVVRKVIACSLMHLFFDRFAPYDAASLVGIDTNIQGIHDFTILKIA